MFKLYSKFKPTGDQPKAIKEITENLKAGVNHQVLLGVTGSGKTFTMAGVIEKIQKPTLIISHNKTLAAQLYQEFKEFFPENAVHYFVSYYDYYQPEAYIPQTNTYIEKDAKINQQLDQLRHAATQDLLTRKDVIIIASVSCIYNIGSPESYEKVSLEIKKGQKIKRMDFLSHLVSLQYQRNDLEFKPGAFRIRGNLVEIYLVTGERIITVEFSGEEISNLIEKKAILNKEINIESLKLFPAQFWVAPKGKLNIALENIRLELQERVNELKKQNKLEEAERLSQRTNYDLEMLAENGYCHGVENYSRHLEFRKPSEAPYSLIDYFSSDFITFIDESHQTIPQIRAMAVQDRARKEALIEYGFRLPSAVDNRPLRFEEFNKKVNQVIYVSATPADYEKRKASEEEKERKTLISVVEQLIRPTGLLEPSIEIRSTKNQIQDLINEIKLRRENGERTLVVTLTKRLAEDISDYLKDAGIKSAWMHSEVKTLERPAILEGLRRGNYDAIVGINLLREGLDLPEVSLVAILDADKEGFLRNETTLVQTMGRAARHPKGHVILYADKKTLSMKKAISEVVRRRKIQEEYNKEHHIVPRAIIKEIRKWELGKEVKPQDILSLMELTDVEVLEKEMKKAAKTLNFEKAAEVRDLIKKLKKEDKIDK